MQQISVWAFDWTCISHHPHPSTSSIRHVWMSTLSVSPFFCCYLTVYCTFPLPPIVKISRLLEQTVIHTTAPFHFDIVPVCFLCCPCLLSQPCPTPRHIFELLYPVSVRSANCQISIQIILCFIFPQIWCQRSWGSDVSEVNMVRLRGSGQFKAKGIIGLDNPALMWLNEALHYTALGLMLHIRLPWHSSGKREREEMKREIKPTSHNTHKLIAYDDG